MASGAAPDTLSERHRLVALLDIAGKRTADIARMLDYTPVRVSTIKGSPLYVALREQLRNELKGQTMGQIVDRLMAEAGPTLDTLIELRDRAEAEPTRLGAANSLADRIPALQRTTKIDEERTVKIVLDGAALAAMAQVQRELQAPPTAAPGTVTTGVSETSGGVRKTDAIPVVGHEVPTENHARTLEESIAAFTEAQRDR